MKVTPLHFLVAVALGASITTSFAQNYPNQPGNPYGDRYGRYGRPGTPGMPGAPGVPQRPAQPAQPAPLPPDALRFSAVPIHTNFYFLVDTNRVNLWTKISSDTASNTVNSKVAKLPAAVLVTLTGNPEPPPAESAPRENPPNSPKDRYPRGKFPRPPAEATPPK